MIAIAVDAILAMVVLEGLGLALYHRRTGRGPPIGALWPNLAAGFLLTAALRLALQAPPTPAIAGAVALVLAAALVAHLVDLARRWPRDTP